MFASEEGAVKVKLSGFGPRHLMKQSRTPSKEAKGGRSWKCSRAAVGREAFRGYFWAICSLPLLSKALACLMANGLDEILSLFHLEAARG